MTMALPDGRPGQLLALGLTLALLALLWPALVGPLITWYGERAETLAQRQAFSRRMEAVADSLPVLQREAAAKAASGPPRAAVLEGDTDAIAGAVLQQMVQDMAGKAGATLPSIETLPGVQAGAYRRIGLRVSLSAPWPVVVGMMQLIEQASPQMLIDDLQLHAPRQTARPDDPPLDATFTILAFRTGTAATATP